MLLQGPPPRDCGVLCVRATATPSAPPEPGRQGSSSQGIGEGGGKAPPGVRVELGVAHCSQSMAVGYLTHAMRAPHISFLRRAAAGDAGQAQQGATGAAAEPALACKTLDFGVHW